MRAFYTSKYQVIQYDKDLKFLKNTWFQSTQKLGEELHTREINKLAEQIRQFEPTKVLVDLREFKHFSTEEQELYAIEKLNTDYATRIAILLSNDGLIAEKVLKAIERMTYASNKTHYFDSELLAMQWLMEDKLFTES